MSESYKEDPRKPAINRLLRCRKTKRYFKADGWTEDISQASTFPDQMEAVRACITHGLSDIDLVLRAPGGRTDLFCTLLR